MAGLSKGSKITQFTGQLDCAVSCGEPEVSSNRVDCSKLSVRGKVALLLVFGVLTTTMWQGNRFLKDIVCLSSVQSWRCRKVQVRTPVYKCQDVVWDYWVLVSLQPSRGERVCLSSILSFSEGKGFSWMLLGLQQKKSGKSVLDREGEFGSNMVLVK